MRAFVVSVILLSQLPSAALARRGLNDGGNCVEPCVKSGGRPCRPCYPRNVGPGDPEWSGTLGSARSDAEAFRAEVRDRAERDPAYRRSDEFAIDRKAAKDFERSVRLMSKASRE
jgi:hypothetical protein